MASTIAPSLFPSELLLYSTASSTSLVGSMALTNLTAPSSTSSVLAFKALADPPEHAIDFSATLPHPSLEGTGGLLFQLERNKAVLNVYSWQKEHPIQRIVLPQKLSCLSLSPSGDFLAAGSPDGRISLWYIATGTLVSSFDAHYRAVTVLRWSTDGRALVSASDDARILIWSVAGLIAPADQSSSSITSSDRTPTPYCTLADHTLAVTDIAVGPGAFPHQMTVWSASLDATVKMWDVRTRALVSTFAFSHPVHRVALDPTERFFFAASAPSTPSAKHAVYRVNLYRRTRTAAGHTAPSTWEPTAQSEMERIPAEGAMDVDLGTRIPIPDAITAMCLSLNGTLLCLGTSAGTLHIVDVHNAQILRSVSLLGNNAASATSSNAVTNLRVLPRPRDLLAATPLPIHPIADFQRQVRSDDNLFDHVAPVRIPDVAPIHQFVDPFALPSYTSSTLTAAAAATAATANAQATSVPLAPQATDPAQLQSLNAEIDTLRAQLERAKRINDQMWHTIVKDRIPTANASQ